MKPVRSSLALALAAAALAPAAATAAPLAAGPQIQLPRIAPVDDLFGASVGPRGDAIVISSPQANCCRRDRALVVRQRRGPRGSFGKPVTIVPASSAERPYANVASALAGNGDAAVVYIGPGGALVSLLRRGWTGAWRPVALPAGASAGAVPNLMASPGGAFDLLWGDRGGIRTARLTDGVWRELSPPAFTAPAGVETGANVLAPGGTALSVFATRSGQIFAAVRRGIGAWGAPVRIGTVAPGPGVFRPTAYVGAGIGRDGSMFATWNGDPIGGGSLHSWYARLRPGASGWDAAHDLGAAGGVPRATTSATGDLAVMWSVGDPNSDAGPAPIRLLRQAHGAPASAPVTVPAPGTGSLQLDDQGGLTATAGFGRNTAEAGVAVVTQERARAPFRVTAPYYGGDALVTASLPYTLLVTAAPEGGTPISIRGIDRLGPLGLVSPATAPVGGKVNVRLNLWKSTTVTVRLLGGPARARVTKRLPAGRSVVALRLPKRAGAYLVQAVGRETPKSRLMTQRAVVRTTSR